MESFRSLVSIGNDLSQVCRLEPAGAGGSLAAADVSRATVLPYRWDSSLTVLTCQESIYTDGLYSPGAIYEDCKASRIRELCLHRALNRAHDGSAV